VDTDEHPRIALCVVVDDRLLAFPPPEEILEHV
jgi:hypothetical protein